MPALVPANRLEQLIHQDGGGTLSNRLRDALFASTLFAPSENDQPVVLSAIIPGSLVADAAGAPDRGELPLALPPILPCFTSQQAIEGARHGLASLLPDHAPLREFAARDILERAAEAGADVLLNPNTSLLRRIAASDLLCLLAAVPTSHV